MVRVRVRTGSVNLETGEGAVLPEDEGDAGLTVAEEGAVDAVGLLGKLGEPEARVELLSGQQVVVHARPRLRPNRDPARTHNQLCSCVCVCVVVSYICSSTM